MLKGVRTKIRRARLKRLRRVDPARHQALVCARLEQEIGQSLAWHPVERVGRNINIADAKEQTHG